MDNGEGDDDGVKYEGDQGEGIAIGSYGSASSSAMGGSDITISQPLPEEEVEGEEEEVEDEEVEVEEEEVEVEDEEVEVEDEEVEDNVECEEDEEGENKEGDKTKPATGSIR